MFGTIVAIVFAAVLAPTNAQTVERFAGTWVAEFDGTRWIRLELGSTGGLPSGQIAIGDMEVDADGRVKAAHKAPDRGSPLLDIAVRDSTLDFARKDGADTDRFELHLVNGEAELRFVLDEATRKELTDNGIPAPKPVRLQRIAR